MPILTLLSDFGLSEPFVGVMKGVVLRHCPDATLVDLTHGIRPQAVAEARFWLERSWSWFPAGSVHLAVVDPGVGTARRGVVVRAARHWFVGPDNGLFAGIFSAAGSDAEARHIDLQRLGLVPPSSTFHGRDVFAPVAARLAAGTLPFETIGPRCELIQGETLLAIRQGEELHGQVVTLDRFGNLITNIERSLLLALSDALPTLCAEAAGRRFKFVSTYALAAPNEGLALINSCDVLELALRDASAAEQLAIGRGAAVLVRKLG